MKYFFKNIAQQGLPRTIVLIVLGIAFWIPSILDSADMTMLLTTLGLMIINSILVMLVFYKGGETNLPSGFVISTYWMAMSAIPALHTCWQAHMVLLGVMLAILALLKMDFQHEATEEAFLATLLCCIVAVVPSILYSGIIMLWGYLIAKQQMTWRVWLSSLIAIAMRVVLMGVLHYMGWLEAIWMENIPHLAWQQWAICGGVFLLATLMILLPLRRPSVGSGIFYTITTVLILAVGIAWHWKLLITL